MFVARSPSDPNKDKGGLTFRSRDDAVAHCTVMNAAIAEYPKNWNEDFWKGVPLPWEVFPQ